MPADEMPRERPRPWLLAVLGIAIVALVFYWMYPSSSSSGPSNQARDPRARQAAGHGESASLDVQLDRLKQPPPGPREADRNPFRFQPKPPPAPPPTFKPPPVAQPQVPVPPP